MQHTHSISEVSVTFRFISFVHAKMLWNCEELYQTSNRDRNRNRSNSTNLLFQSFAKPAMLFFFFFGSAVPPPLTINKVLLDHTYTQ